MLFATTPDEIAETDRLLIAARQAYDREYQRQLRQRRAKPLAARRAAALYRSMMPTPTGIDSLRRYFSLLMQGLILGTLDGDTASRMLYATQIACSLYLGESGAGDGSFAGFPDLPDLFGELPAPNPRE